MGNNDNFNVSSSRLLRFRARRGLSRLASRTGFQGKTLWDAIQLLALPLLIAFATILFNLNSQKSDETRAAVQRIHEQDNLRIGLVQSYYDDMTSLVLDRGLTNSTPGSPVRQIARSKTLAAMYDLGQDRKGAALLFLYELNLIHGDEPIVPLNGVSFHSMRLPRANLHSANLSRANLHSALLFGTNLKLASLENAVLQSAHLEEANLQGANLSNANLFRSHLSGADLRGADLSKALLSHADLTDVNLEGSTLTGASLSDADLTDAEVTNSQLAQAYTFLGTTMPDGSRIMTLEEERIFKQKHGRSR